MLAAPLAPHAAVAYARHELARDQRGLDVEARVARAIGVLDRVAGGLADRERDLVGLEFTGAGGVQKALEPVWMINQPLKRRGSPRDVANLALFLASERSAQVTGQVIAVDGGITAGDPINLNALLNEARESFLQSF